MTIRWIPDSCDCILLFTPGTPTFIQWEKKCDLHKLLSGQAHLDAVITHNQSFQIAGASQNSPTLRDTNVATKIAAKAAIIATGPTTTNSAFVNPRMFGNP